MSYSVVSVISVVNLFVLLSAAVVFAQSENLPRLTEPVNDFAGVIDASSAAALDRMIRALQAASGDVIVVVTVDRVAPFADIREYAVKLFENHGAGIGEKGRDNGLLVLLAVGDRRVWIEVGYGLEPIVTDGFAGETSRRYMTPEFRNGRYGAGLLRGVERLAGRIAEARNVTVENVTPVRAPPASSRFPVSILLFVVILIFLISRAARPPWFGRRRRGYWGGSPWSGWNSGVGSFGGGGFGRTGGGFGGGFGGFGGGRSGGGGGGAGW